MLQQTRVAVVIPYYERFLKHFPDVQALAAAPETEVLALWSGLGYYSRARNLQKGAARIVEAGGFPISYETIRELAGVGDYTAAAISSIAFDLPHAAVDGNIRRVLARLVNDDWAPISRTLRQLPTQASMKANAAGITRPKTSGRSAQELADLLLDRRDPGLWNQALMELGATVCLPRNPQCDPCPLARHCEAHRLGTQHQVPGKRLKPEPIHLTRTLLLVRRGRRILLVPSSRVKGFWDLPEALDDISLGKKIYQFRHTITHRHYRFLVHEAKFASTPLASIPKDGLWWSGEDLPLSTAAKKALRIVKSSAARPIEPRRKR
jgi:A/G-specific adenine glycosylase